MCSCQQNYNLSTDGKSCSPYNNCEASNGGCDQACNYLGPALSNCSCYPGYTSASNSNSAICVSSSASSASTILGGAVGGSGSAILIVIIVVVIFLRRRRNQELNRAFDFNKLVEANSAALASGVTRNIPTELKRSAIEVVSVLGKGAFGEVSKAKMTEAQGKFSFLVAVKVLHRSGAESLAARESLLNEASLMAQFDHDNVVRLIGVVTAGEPLLVVLEFCEIGALDSYVKSHDLTPAAQVKISIDCSKGMQYLASLHFVHRDLASRNVLLDSSLTGKIADFGLSRESEENKDYYASKGGALPIRWTAPEALEHRKFSEKSDVWSFGILLYEIWTKAMLPYNGMTNDKVWIKVLEGYRLPCPLGCPNGIYSIMQSCWFDASVRPPFSEIAEALRSEYNTVLTKSESNHNDAGNSGIGKNMDPVSETGTSAKFSLTYLVPDDTLPTGFGAADVAGNDYFGNNAASKSSLTYMIPDDDWGKLTEDNIMLNYDMAAKNNDSDQILSSDQSSSLSQFNVIPNPYVASLASTTSVATQSASDDNAPAASRIDAEKSYVYIKSMLNKSDVIDPVQIYSVLSYLGVSAKASQQAPSVTGIWLAQVNSERKVLQKLGIKAFGNCRRFIQIIQDLKANKAMKQPVDINMDGKEADYTKWSIKQVGAWAKSRGLAEVASLLSMNAIAGDVIFNMNLDAFFLLTNFPVTLQSKFEDEVDLLRGMN